MDTLSKQAIGSLCLFKDDKKALANLVVNQPSAALWYAIEYFLLLNRTG
ncbi:hypothetical protein [Halalkalibacter alkalisediminis]|nr:hypothetical protein [Halalkalibacter alkalisediminis]